VGSAIKKTLTSHFVRTTSRSIKNSDLNKCFHKTISSSEDFSDSLKDIDVVIHAAARVHQMKDTSKNPLKDFMETNCHGTLNLAKQAALHGVKRFIFISSMKVNGEKTNPGKFFRYDDKINPQDPYGVSKAEAENGLINIAANSNMEIVIIRPPLVYGPKVRANFESLLKLSKKNLPLPLGGINNKRSFVA
jgi:nucleoside-diphosphate-sugar epimerase